MPKRKLYGTELSGHAWRVAVLLRSLHLHYEFCMAPAEVRVTAEYKALNPFGEIPVLEDDGAVIADSNAILVYLAKRYDTLGTWLPDDPFAAALVQRWLSVAAGDVFYGPALARMIVQFGYEDNLTRAQEIAFRLLKRMDAHLEQSPYLAGADVSLADLACYSYVSRSDEGGVAIDSFKHVVSWCARIEELPGFYAMPHLTRPSIMYVVPT